MVTEAMITPEMVQAAKQNQANGGGGEVNPLLIRAKDSAAMLPYWDQVDTIIQGYDAVKSAGTTYLPMFPDEQTTDYGFRLQCTKLTNIYRDVLEALSTKPFEDEITLIAGDTAEGESGGEIDADAAAFVENVDGAGNNISMFSYLTFFNGINDAVSWIFVDYPTIDPGTVMSQAEAKSKDIKPFWSHVLARNILEVRSKVVGAKETIVYIRIFEPANDVISQDRVRVFERTDAGVVSWTLYEKVPNAKTVETQFVSVGAGVLSINVIPLVPFITGRREGRTYKFAPAMRDASDLQLVLYKDESALQFIKTMAGYPMLAANGMKPQMEADGKTPKKLSIGPMRVLYGLPDGAGNYGTWGFIEPNSNSMDFLQKSIDKTKQDLRELGRQPLTALSSQLTTVTTSIAAGKARSAVTAWAYALKDSLENALMITMLYMKKNVEPEVNVYTGFDNVTDNAADLDALATARADRDISRETYCFELKRRKVLSPEFNFETETKRLLTEIPAPGDEIDPVTGQPITPPVAGTGGKKPAKKPKNSGGAKPK